MTTAAKEAFYNEITKGKELFGRGKLSEAYSHFERAHIVGQRSVVLHTISHYWFLRVGLTKRDFREISGQLVRLPLGILGSMLGVVPEGNTGGSNVSLLASLPTPEDLKPILESKS